MAQPEAGKSATLKLATAAMVGGAAATGAIFGARALARRNGGRVNQVLANAMTASEAAAACREREVSGPA